MDRTERLFSILDTLRRSRRPVTAAALADEHEVSVRTMYRDVQMLIGLGARIEGEAGVGYVLRPGFFLPPLMFEPEELEALVLGARWVQGQPDAALSKAAGTALAKISTASPDDLRRLIDDIGLWPVSLLPTDESRSVLGQIRTAMREERALEMSYVDESDRRSDREIWPVQLAFYDGKQIVVAWCVLRRAFRHFRIDRIQQLEVTSRRFGSPRTVLSREWWAEWQARRGS